MRHQFTVTNRGTHLDPGWQIYDNKARRFLPDVYTSKRIAKEMAKKMGTWKPNEKQLKEDSYLEQGQGNLMAALKSLEEKAQPRGDESYG